jgi:hypothetical protein
MLIHRSGEERPGEGRRGEERSVKIDERREESGGIVDVVMWCGVMRRCESDNTKRYVRTNGVTR